MEAHNASITREIFENRLFDAEFFKGGLVQESREFALDNDAIEGFRATLRDAFKDMDSWGSTEANVRTRVILPILHFLDWPFLEEQIYTIQGKPFRPDYVLFKDRAATGAQGAGGKDTPQGGVMLQSESAGLSKGVVAILEAKAADKKMDTGKVDRLDNPYMQLVEYLTYARMDRGFLCNGRELWLVDTSQPSTAKHYVKVDLIALTEHGTHLDWKLFYLLFARKSHVDHLPDTSNTAYENITRLDWQQKNLSECELRNVIYGTGGKSSMIELIGQALYRTAQARGETLDTAEIFSNAQFFAFRLLFLAFFESKYLNTKILPKKCDYDEISLQHIFDRCLNISDEKLERHTEWQNLQILFNIIDKGNVNLAIPLFNGGLFSDENARMLAWPRVLDNREISEILKMLFLYEGKLRDFSVLSVTQLGTIYEGLLGFEFRIAPEKIWYLDYKPNGKSREEGYFILSDYAQIESDKKNTIYDRKIYEKGSLYLVSSSNSRKTTASYYTPTTLSSPLVRRAIDHLLTHMDESGSILDVRILDSACGSGHLLVESLNYLTGQALLRIEDDPKLNEALIEEKQRIAEAFVKLGLIDGVDELDIDETAILKRILLKKNIYGVDIQQFSVELTCLSLWIETFIFGTPLSFLEHHVKQGNSLVGCSRSKFDKALSDAENEFGLSKEQFQHKRETLFKLYQKLSALRDTTAEDIRQSKRIYREEIRPIIEEMNLFFDCITMKEIKKLQGKRTQPCRELFEQIDGHLHGRAKNGNGKALVDEIGQYKKEFGFFNWQLEFPEAFANGSTSGFHVIVGNPPWDKTKFSDADFFSQYRSNYRTATNSRKKEMQADLLDNTAIARRYATEQETVKLVNEYYKRTYPRNAGAGDGNLFRFFVERSLGLLRPGGTLNYVLPTGFMTEDGSETLRKYTLEAHHILAFDGFENREGLFPDIDNRYKFGLLQIEKSWPAQVAQEGDATRQTASNIAPEEKITRCRFMLTDPAALEDESTAFHYTLKDVQSLSQEHWAFMEVRGGREDLDLLTKLYAKFPPISPEWIDFRRELDATNDKAIFKETGDDGDIPLYKGACIWQYDSQYWKRTGSAANAPQYWLDPAEFDAYLRDTEISRLIADVYGQLDMPDPKKTKEKNVLDALCLSRREELGQFVLPDRIYYRLGFRDIARDTDERTFISVVIPPDTAVQSTLWVSIPKKYQLSDMRIIKDEISLQKIFFAQAIFNSLIVDWILRFSVAIHATKSYVMRLPIPQPSNIELENNPIYTELAKNSLLLSYSNNEDVFRPLLEQFGIGKNEAKITEKKSMALKVRNDVLVSSLYGVTMDEMEYVLKSFPIFVENNPAYVIMLRNSISTETAG